MVCVAAHSVLTFELQQGGHPFFPSCGLVYHSAVTMACMQQYELKHSKRARYMRLAVWPGGAVVVTVPHGSSTYIVERFMRDHADWIDRSVRRMRHVKALPRGTRTYKTHKEATRALVHERIARWNAHYGFSFERVAIKDTKTLWGSCSRRGNLNFSYKLLFLPLELVDYVVVHELCHLKERNHAPAFWRLVAQTIPDYAQRRRELRRYLLQ